MDSQIIKSELTTLNEMATEAHYRCVASAKQTIEYAKEAGEVLLEIRGTVENFDVYCKENLPFGHTQARRYMDVAEYFDQITDPVKRAISSYHELGEAHRKQMNDEKYIACRDHLLNGASLTDAAKESGLSRHTAGKIYDTDVRPVFLKWDWLHELNQLSGDNKRTAFMARNAYRLKEHAPDGIRFQQWAADQLGVKKSMFGRVARLVTRPELLDAYTSGQMDLATTDKILDGKLTVEEALSGSVDTLRDIVSQMRNATFQYNQDFGPDTEFTFSDLFDARELISNLNRIEQFCRDLRSKLSEHAGEELAKSISTSAIKENEECLPYAAEPKTTSPTKASSLNMMKLSNSAS